MKAKELAEKLLENPESEVWCGAWNGYADTYTVVDHTLRAPYDQISNDFFGTPGRLDKRVLRRLEDSYSSDQVIFLGSRFGRCPNPNVDFGDDFIDYPIKTLNDDPDLLWKRNGFIQTEEGVWERSDQNEGWEMLYDTETEVLEVVNSQEQIKFIGKISGIESLRKCIETCKINISIHL